MRSHLSLVKESFLLLTQAIDSFIDGDIPKGQELLRQSKSMERKADVYIEQMTRATYSGAWRATDAYELSQFSSKIDKSLGYSIRSVRKLLDGGALTRATSDRETRAPQNRQFIRAGL